MVLQYISKSNIEDKKELLSWFYPKLIAKQNILLDNKESKLVKAISKNPHLGKLVEKLDLMEV